MNFPNNKNKPEIQLNYCTVFMKKLTLYTNASKNVTFLSHFSLFFKK